MLKNATILGLTLLLSCQLLTAQVDRPLDVANEYLQNKYSTLGLTALDVAHYKVSSKVVSQHNKLTHVYLQQSHADIPVHNAILNMNIRANGEMLSLGNRFVPDLANRINTTQPSITPAQAVVATQTYFGLPIDSGLKLAEQTSPRAFVFDHAGLALEPINVKLMYQFLNEQVRLVWNVEYYELTGQNWWVARVDALTGEMLNFNNQVVHCEFDLAHNDCEEEKTSVPASNTFFFGPGDENSAYRAFPLFIESPNHGGRELIVDPADALASPFGWHDTNGEEGHEFTITRGNNVHAYHDIFNNNQSNGDEPDGGDSLCFDFSLDLSLNRPYSQLDAATTNLFYWNNLIHDVWYYYGFDEASGNFQVNNYGRGGDGNDHVNAEALDGSGTNNANFGTPADGGNPRMQMYLWGGNLPSFPEPTLLVTAPASVAGVYGFDQAGFGGDFPDGTLALDVVLVDDGIGVTSDACDPIMNGAALAGKAAMIDRGDCEFGFKALAAQSEGATMVIICNNVPDPQGLGGGAVGDQVVIPVIGMDLAVCNQIKVGLPELMIELTGSETSVPLPGPSGLDSDYDNGVIVHEYGHGISNRLTGGAAQAGCLSGFEQAGEGWSDWFALVMTTTSADNAEEGRGIGTYVSDQPTNGGGIRPFRYSRDMGVDPHTYTDINSVSVPHGVGSVWCVMIWDLYWNLVDEYGFDDDIYEGTGGNNIAMQLVMDGLKLQPCTPDFIDARNAIIEADEVNNDGVNRCLIWETFARRGLGVNASPGGAENFDKPNTCPPAFRVLKTGVAEAEAGDVLTYELTIANGRANSIDAAVVVDQLPPGTTLVAGSSDCDLTVVDGVLMINLGDFASGSEITCSYQLQTSTDAFSYTVFEDMVGGSGNWDFIGLASSDTWQLRLNNTNTGLLSFYARNQDEVSDQVLLQEEPVFLDGLNPGLSFYHEYRTEGGFDGGVVEISINGGTDWEDVGEENFIENGYTRELEMDGSGNPLAGRPAFTGATGGFIRSVVDLSDYAGETALIRFRFGTNEANGNDGWYVDDISIFGNLTAVTNVACTDNGGEQLCSSVTTILFGQDTATEELVQDLPLSLFPNPTDDKVTISLPEPLATQVDVQLRSIEGRLLKSYQFTNFYRETIDVSRLSAGVYILQFRTEEGVTTRRLVVE